METRSSPSLEQLRRLAKQADMKDEDVSSLSKPALYGHLRSHFDYEQLERAHEVSLIGGGEDSPEAPRRKRVCRSRRGGASSRVTPPELQSLPPASILIQTRSRSRMLALAASGGGGGSGAVFSPGVPAPTPARATATATARPRSRRLQASRRGNSSRGKSGSTSNSTANSGGGSSVDTERSEGSEESESIVGTKRKRGGGSRGGGSGGNGSGARARAVPRSRVGNTRGKDKGNSKGNGKSKVKAKANASGGGVAQVRRRACGSRGAKVSGGGDKGKKCEKGDRNNARPNELDPIMLVKIGKHHYRFVRPNGRVVKYNLDSLVDYFISTGDFLEPETRLPFSDEELRAIDVKVKAAGLSKPSVLEAKRNPSRYTEQKFQQDALVGLERMLSELVTSMLKVVEESEREEGEIRLVAEIFPPFADLFKQLWAADRAFARQCMQHYTSWLQGPPNRPTEDEMGFLDIILGFLKQLQDCEGNSSLGF